MHAVAARDVRLLLDAAATLYAGPPAGRFAQRALRAVASLVPSASVTFDVLPLATPRSAALVSPDETRMTMMVRMDADTIGVAHNRDQVAFTRRDRLLLRLLQPHIATVYQRECGNTIDASAVAPLLTPREREVLHWAASGMTNQEIGRALRISGRTVQVHLAHACRKLGARSRTGAVVALLRESTTTGW